MVTGTGNPVLCLDNNSDGAISPEPTLADRGVPDPVRISPIRVTLKFVPVEPPCFDKNHTRKKVRTYSQALRCPHCRALVAVGHSWDHHTHFCGRTS